MNSEIPSSPEVKAAVTELMFEAKPVTARSNARVGSFLLSWLAIFVGVACVIISGYMFYRFAENDVGFKVLLSAFALCFGVGALAYIPLFLIAKLIRAGRMRPAKGQVFWTLALSVPWLIAGAILITYPNAMRYFGGLAVGLSLLFIFWSVRHWAHIRRKQA